MRSLAQALPTQGPWNPRCTSAPIRPAFFPPGHCLHHHNTQPKNPVLRTSPSYLRAPGWASPASNSCWSHVPSAISTYQDIASCLIIEASSARPVARCPQCHPHPVCLSSIGPLISTPPPKGFPFASAYALYKSWLNRASERAREIEGRRVFVQLPLVCFACNPQIPSNPISNCFVKWVETMSFSPTCW